MNSAIVKTLMAMSFACLLLSTQAEDAQKTSDATQDAAEAKAQTQPEAVEKSIDPQADALLKGLFGKIAQAQAFSVKAEIWQDVRMHSTGQRIQIGKEVLLQVKRPNRFHIEMKSPRRHNDFYYDGKSITLYNSVKKFYGSFDAPASMDDALDLADDKFGVDLPLEDLIVSDPYKNALDHAVKGLYLTTVSVLGVPCEHLAFTDGKIDWQLWIDKSDGTTLRKAVLTYLDEENSPSYTVIFSDWNFDAKLPDSNFEFTPPEGAAKIDVSALSLKPAPDNATQQNKDSEAKQ